MLVLKTKPSARTLLIVPKKSQSRISQAKKPDTDEQEGAGVATQPFIGMMIHYLWRTGDLS